VDWLVAELDDEETGRHEDYADSLASVLLHADPLLLLPMESKVVESRHFPAALVPPFTERLRMLAWDEAVCWQELEAFCEAAAGSQSPEKVELGRAERIVEALARHGTGCEERVLKLLR
jgi:hypothetical protein